jgi:hypothetical protein
MPRDDGSARTWLRVQAEFDWIARPILQKFCVPMYTRLALPTQTLLMESISRETIFYNANFLPWSLSNIPIGSSTLTLLNKMTHRTCGQPHGIRTGFVLRVDLELT